MEKQKIKVIVIYNSHFVNIIPRDCKWNWFLLEKYETNNNDNNSYCTLKLIMYVIFHMNIFFFVSLQKFIVNLTRSIMIHKRILPQIIQKQAENTFYTKCFWHTFPSYTQRDKDNEEYKKTQKTLYQPTFISPIHYQNIRIFKRCK